MFEKRKEASEHTKRDLGRGQRRLRDDTEELAGIR